MQATLQLEPIPQETIDRYARAVAASKRVRWSIDEDVIRNRTFDTRHKFLPEGLSKANEFTFLSESEQRYLSQIQGRTYANIFGLVERYITTKILELSHEHCFGDQTELFRRIEKLVAATMPSGYQFLPDPDEVAKVVLTKSTWAVLALTMHIELFTQLHYRQSIEPDENLSPLFKDVFLYHWKEESQHTIVDELEWVSCDRNLSAEERDRAVDEFIDLVVAVDGILRMQAATDARYFAETCGRRLSSDEKDQLEAGILRAYRWQYILSGAQHPYFIKALTSKITEAQTERITSALSLLA
jgi:hypothetical protein